MATTPSTRRAQIRPGGLVRPGIAAVPLPSVELDPRTAYDFLASACNSYGELEELLPEDRRWREEAQAAFSAEHPAIQGRSYLDFVFELGRMIVDRPSVRTAQDVVAFADSRTDRELTEDVLGELAEDPDLAELTHRAIDGDEAAFAELQARLDHMKGDAVVPGSVSDIAPAVRAVIHFWLPRYQRIEARVGQMLERDVAARRRQDLAADPLGFVEQVTNGLRMVPELRIRRMVLAPTYFGRPYNSLTVIGETQLIAYPIADSSLGSADRLMPPNSTVRLYRALGDESRLRILKFLAESDRYLTEIANELDLSKPTIKHHLAILRAAGLLTVTEQGNMTWYSLRRDRAEEAGPELRAFLSH
jgi:DNA-binding transcriptional ArsR family regulator